MAFGPSFAKHLVCRLGVVILGLMAAWQPASAAPLMKQLTLVVPATPNGGWDLTAKAMKATLEQDGIVTQVDILRYPGVGGLVGLSQFVSRHRGRSDMLLVGGLAMIGAAMADDAAISLRDVVPIARLTGDWGLIAVRSNSPIRTFEDLKSAMLTRSNMLRWSGGALGGPDEALVWGVADNLGLRRDEILYYGKVGGHMAALALLDSRAEAAVSGYAEFMPYVQRGQFRLIAVSSPTRLPGIDVPTLRELGVDVSIMNWRGVFAAPGLSAAEQDRLSDVVARMHKSPRWHDALVRSRWTDAYLDSVGFPSFIDREMRRWPMVIQPPALSSGRITLANRIDRTVLWILGGLAVLLAIGTACLVAILRARRAKVADLERSCGDLKLRLEGVQASSEQVIKDGIQDDFGSWNLSSAERDVAWFMLRGLPLKQIAGLRGTSERTVRQQAQSIYRKAGLESRSDLAGRVLERFI